MISWFRNNAPIHGKFRVVVAFQIAVAALSLGLIYLAAVLPATELLRIMLSGTALASLPVLLTWYSGKLISDPYVTTVVRMEGLAAGGYRVVAEGVETSSAAEIVAALGCEEAQGFWFSRPLEADAFASWMRSADGRRRYAG